MVLVHSSLSNRFEQVDITIKSNSPENTNTTDESDYDYSDPIIPNSTHYKLLLIFEIPSLIWLCSYKRKCSFITK